MNLDDFSREDLYEKVWSTPGSKLSEEFGISDVAIAKRCRKLNVPRPPRGYWAKIEAGHSVKREPLPPTHEQIFIREAAKPVDKNLALPAESIPLHPLATELLQAAKSAKLSYDRKRVHIRQRSIPEADISKDMAGRAAMAFHVLLQVVEPRGINFRRSQSSYDGGHFRKGNDYLYFKIEEALVAKPETGAKRRAYFATREENQVPCGRLTFTFKTERYGSSKPRNWTESESAPLETILAEMAKFICDHYVEAQRRREAEAIERERQQVEWEIRRKKQQEEEVLQKQEAARQKHTKTLEATERHRREDLAKAAEWWRLHQSAAGFISECERRWSDAQAGELSTEQKNWLTWARDTANALSPFEGQRSREHATDDQAPPPQIQISARGSGSGDRARAQAGRGAGRFLVVEWPVKSSSFGKGRLFLAAEENYQTRPTGRCRVFGVFRRRRRVRTGLQPVRKDNETPRKEAQRVRKRCEMRRRDVETLRKGRIRRVFGPVRRFLFGGGGGQA